MAARALEGTAELAGRVPAGFGWLLSALDFHLSTPVEIAFVGTPGEAETEALLRVAARTYLPNAVTALRRPEEEGEAEELVPLLRGRTARGGRPTAYVCERLACQQPVNEPAELAEQLGARGGAPERCHSESFGAARTLRDENGCVISRPGRAALSARDAGCRAEKSTLGYCVA